MYVVPLATESAHFEEASDEQLHSLSQILMRSFQRQHAVLGEPDWNLVLRSAPLRGRSTQSAYDADRFTRWHLVITPRLGGACVVLREVHVEKERVVFVFFFRWRCHLS